MKIITIFCAFILMCAGLQLNASGKACALKITDPDAIRNTRSHTVADGAQARTALEFMLSLNTPAKAAAPVSPTTPEKGSLLARGRANSNPGAHRRRGARDGLVQVVGSSAQNAQATIETTYPNAPQNVKDRVAFLGLVTCESAKDRKLCPSRDPQDPRAASIELRGLAYEALTSPGIDEPFPETCPVVNEDYDGGVMQNGSRKITGFAINESRYRKSSDDIGVLRIYTFRQILWLKYRRTKGANGEKPFDYRTANREETFAYLRRTEERALQAAGCSRCAHVYSQSLREKASKEQYKIADDDGLNKLHTREYNTLVNQLELDSDNDKSLEQPPFAERAVRAYKYARHFAGQKNCKYHQPESVSAVDAKA